MWGSAKLRGRDVVLGVTTPQTVVRELSLPNLPLRELRKSLPFQVREMLPLPVDKSLLDFFPLEASEDGKTLRGLLIAAPKEAVLTAVHAIEQAGLHVARVDLASFALLRAASYLDEKVEAIVDIGAHATSVVVHHAGAPLIVRTLPRGGAEITERIAARVGATVPEAESIKCRVGLLDDGGPDTAAVVREAIRPLISEIGSSFTYLTTGDRQARVARVALSGGGAQLPGLVDALRGPGGSCRSRPTCCPPRSSTHAGRARCAARWWSASSRWWRCSPPGTGTRCTRPRWPVPASAARRATSPG